MIQPETSREEIRELKRFNKAEPEAGIADDMRQLVEKFYYDNPEILNAVFKEPEFTEETIKRFIEIVNPGGNRSYKKGLYFLMMYENRVAVKKFGTNPQNLSWWEFWQITRDIFGETAAGPKTWQNYFGDEEKEEQPSESDITEENNHMQAETHEIHAEKQTKKTADQKEDSESEEISGQMEIQDYPEILPEEKSESVQQEGIAPAQKPEREREEEIKETEETSKHSLTAMNEPEIIDRPFGTRKDYMDSLTAYGMAEYIAAEYERHSLKAGYMSSKIMLENWLLEKVDAKGYSIEEGKNNEIDRPEN